MNTKCKSFDALIRNFKKLPGIGERSAFRLAYYIACNKKGLGSKLAHALIEADKKIRYCKQCSNLTESELCVFCSDARRDSQTICVVEEIADLLAIEKAGNYSGLYHLLHGSISPISGTGPNDITINLEADFDEPYSPLNFPLETEKGWGLPPAIVTLDGTARSPLFRLVKIANTLAGLLGKSFLPPEFVFLLPVIDIGELLTLMMESNEIEIPEIPDYLYRDVRAFLCLPTAQHTVDAGTFQVREISMVRGIGMVYYSADVGNIIEMRGNFADILPILDDMYIELIEWET